MNCRECRTHLLAKDITEATQSHLDECIDCQRVQASMQVSGDWLSNDVVWAEPSADLRSRFLGEFEESAPPARNIGRRRWVGAVVAAVIAIGAIAVGISNRPDWEIDLVGTETAPLASASIAGWNDGNSTRLRLDPTGLPVAPDGSFYELWFSGPDGLISAGTFTTADPVELVVGVKRRAFPRIWVTLEQIDADPLPSGTTLLSTP